jgi:hypothetical protein
MSPLLIKKQVKSEVLSRVTFQTSCLRNSQRTSGTTSFFNSNAEYLLDATFTLPSRQSK